MTDAPRACRRCGLVSPGTYCPACRKTGRVVKLLTAAELNRLIQTMRKDAGKIQVAIKNLTKDN